MAAPRLSDELAQQAAAAYRAAGNKCSQAAADSLGIPQPTLVNRLKVAASRGLLLDTPAAMPGFRVSQVSDGPAGKSVQQKPEHGDAFAVPAGHVVKGVSTLVDPDGNKIVEWIKTKQGEIDPLAIAEWLKAAFVDYVPAANPTPAPASHSADLLTLIPANDWHIGLSAWGKQVGVNWDLKIAEEVIGPTIEDVIARSSPSAESIVLGGGDLLHADNRMNQTTGGTPQDVDGRYQKVVEVTGRLMVRTVDAALRQHQRVTVRILPGNHDEHACVAIAWFLFAWYRNEPRVTVDVDPSLFFWFRFGQVLIGSTHGHMVKIDKMPGIMAHRRAEDWGQTKFRYVHGFHLHHSAKFATEGNGVVSEIHQAPIPQDAWHYGSGFCSGRSVQAITYHRHSGEKGRVREALLDGGATA